MEAKAKQHILGREDILSARDLATETVEVPEWGGSVLVRVLSGTERDRLEETRLNWLTDERGKVIGLGPPRNVGTRARIAAASIVDEDGTLVFTVDDIEALGRKSGDALDRVAEVATRLSGLEPEAVEKAKAVLKVVRSASAGSSSRNG